MFIEIIKANQKLEQILSNFIDVLRINIMVVDSKGKPVLAPKTSGYGFHGSTQWGALNDLGTPKFLSKFQIEGDYLKCTDIFGFQSFAIPIPIGDSDIGYLVVGPVVLNKQFEISRYQDIAQQLNLDFSDFIGHLSEVRVVTFNSLKSILDLLFDLSRYALRTNFTQNPQASVESDQTRFAHLIFTNLLDLAMTLTQAECGSIMLLNKITNELSVQVSKGIDMNKSAPVKLGEGIAGLAAQERESFVINGKPLSSRIRHLLTKPELKCAVVLPIINNNKEVLGVMNISTHQGTSRLATHSKEMLNSLIEITSGTLSSFL